MSVYILPLSLLLLFNKWVQTSYGIVQESINGYMSSSNQKRKDILLTVHTSDPLTFTTNAKKSSVQNSKDQIRCLLMYIGALITCSSASLKACTQKLSFQQQLQKYMLPPEGKKNREGENETFSPRPSKFIFQAGLSKNAEIFQGEGLEIYKIWRTFHGQHTTQGTFVSR